MSKLIKNSVASNPEALKYFKENNTYQISYLYNIIRKMLPYKIGLEIEMTKRSTVRLPKSLYAHRNDVRVRHDDRTIVNSGIHRYHAFSNTRYKYLDYTVNTNNEATVFFNPYSIEALINLKTLLEELKKTYLLVEYKEGSSGCSTHVNVDFPELHQAYVEIAGGDTTFAKNLVYHVSKFFLQKNKYKLSCLQKEAKYVGRYNKKHISTKEFPDSYLYSSEFYTPYIRIRPNRLEYRIFPASLSYSEIIRFILICNKYTKELRHYLYQVGAISSIRVPY